MKLIDNAGQVWHRFWSLRFAALAAVLSGASVAATMALPEHTSLRAALLMGLLTTASAIASVLARVVRQETLPLPAAEPPAPQAHEVTARDAALADVRLLARIYELSSEDVFGGDDGR